MAQTKAHGGKVLGIETVQQCGELRTDAVEELGHFRRDNLNAELLLDGFACTAVKRCTEWCKTDSLRTESCLEDGKGLFTFPLPHDLLREKLFQ